MKARPSVEKPSRAEVWLIDLNPTMGREQAGQRPALVISNDVFNHGRVDLVAVLPITTTDRGIPLHVAISPGEGGLPKQSFVLCDQVRTISKARLLKRFGTLAQRTLLEVEDRLRIHLQL